MLLRPSLQAMAAKFSHLYLRTFSRYLVCPGEGVVRISSDRDDRKIFLGLKVSISGFWLFNLKIRDSSRVSWRRSSCRNFYGSQIRHGIFWGLNFGSGIFFGSHWNPWDFGEVFIFAPIRSSLSLEIQSALPPPPPQAVCMSTLTLPWQPSLAMTMFCKICNFHYRQSELATHVASIYADLWEQKKAFTYEKSSTPIGLVWEQTWPPFHCFGTQIWPP